MRSHFWLNLAISKEGMFVEQEIKEKLPFVNCRLHAVLVHLRVLIKVNLVILNLEVKSILINIFLKCRPKIPKIYS